MISSYAKVLIPNMGYNIFYSWQERSLLAVNGIPDSRNCVGTQIFLLITVGGFPALEFPWFEGTRSVKQ